MRKFSKVEILRISSFLWSFSTAVYSLDVFIYASRSQTTLLTQICLFPFKLNRLPQM